MQPGDDETIQDRYAATRVVRDLLGAYQRRGEVEGDEEPWAHRQEWGT